MAQRSPFPGMDPWLERYWSDIHHKIIDNLADQIAAGLPDALFVRVEEMVYVIDSPGGDRLIRPDVALFDFGSPAEAERDTGGVAVARPIRISIPEEPITEGYIEIRELREGHPLVTAVEVLSPTNKSNPTARAEYLQKREGYYRAKINVVELDLLRGGRHLVGVSLERLHPSLNTPYKCVVRRGGAMAGLEYYPLPLRERLPRIGIPLRSHDPVVGVDLQLPVDLAYERGRYSRIIDYTQLPEPPLSPDDAEWAAGMIAEARRTA